MTLQEMLTEVDQIAALVDIRPQAVWLGAELWERAMEETCGQEDWHGEQIITE